MAANSTRTYIIPMTRVSVSGAITLNQVKAGSTVPLKIVRISMTQMANSTSATQSLQINRKSGAATVTSQTPLLVGPVTDPAASASGGTSASGVNASAEGTDTNVIYQDGWNFANGGYNWAFNEQTAPFVDATGIAGLKFPVAPGSAITMSSDLTINELA